MIILASESPRRKELLKKLSKEFTIIPANIDESILKIPACDLPGELSRLKAYEVFSKYPNDTVIACDTVVILDGVVMGKPHTKEKASEMLHKLSGKKHVVISGYTFINKEKEITRTVRTYVYFNKLSDELIDKYIASGSPMDKAGAYGIQDKDFDLVNHIEGSFDNVMGLPTEDLKQHCF